MISNKTYLWKIFTEDEFEKINYVGRHSAARLGRGFQTRPVAIALACQYNIWVKSARDDIVVIAMSSNNDSGEPVPRSLRRSHIQSTNVYEYINYKHIPAKNS